MFSHLMLIVVLLFKLSIRSAVHMPATGMGNAFNLSPETAGKS